MTVLVIGATGRVAGHLTRLLREDDVKVRALVRNRDKAVASFADPAGSSTEPEIVDGSFDDPAVLGRAFDGVEAAFLALGTSQQQIALEKGLIDAAAGAGVPHVVRLSVLDSDPDAGYEVARRHAELDAHLAASGVRHSLLRPAYFSSNLLAAAASIASQDQWFGTAPTGRVAVVDTRDVAHAAAVVIRSPAPRNAVYDLTGPEGMTFPEVARRFSAVLGRKINYTVVDEATSRHGLLARGVPDWLADIAIGIDTAMQAGRHSAVNGQLERLTGRAPRPIDDFIRSHHTLFTAAER